VFRRIVDVPETLMFTFDGRPLRAAPGDSVAAALLRSGVDTFGVRSVGETPRGPHCLAGICFECLVTIDGVPDRQSCQAEVVEGMVVASQHGVTTLAGEEVR
jgi:predicted molibdopterin-dependent oxidoreductase YjgC